jgi:uncharacterized protein (TIGR00375 family)
VEEIMEVSKRNIVVPAHVWTPWFSVFGANNGFDRLEDCYEDMTKHIFAIETGLSSNPPMNWRLSQLDKYALISNSDSHSPWPWRIGREANVFEIKQLTYEEIVDTLRKKNPQHFKFTIETDPAYGKYHWTGHRKCNVSFPPQEVIELNYLCPVCKKSLTKGVDQRVEELADRPIGFEPNDIPGFINILPLSELISSVIGSSSPNIKGVWNIYNSLITKFGNEYTVLMESSKEEISKVVNPEIVNAILLVRTGKIKIIPGYDGVYGQLKLPTAENNMNEVEDKKSKIRFGLDRWL